MLIKLTKPSPVYSGGGFCGLRLASLVPDAPASEREARHA